MGKDLIEKIALAICGYSIDGKPVELCVQPCVLCLGQAKAVIAVIKDEEMLNERKQPVKGDN